MKRVILSIPADTRFDLLSEAAQRAISVVNGQWVSPMPGTQPYNARVLIDAVATDDFTPSVFASLGLNWVVLGLWQWDGATEPLALVPLDTATLLAHLPDQVVINEAGETVETFPPTPHLPHRWGGWPDCA